MIGEYVNPTTADFIAMYSIEYDKEDDSFVITYDDYAELTYINDDDTECKINMDNDYGNNNSNKLNMMWIEDIKKQYNWKVGDVIYLNGKQDCDNCFYIMRGWRDDDDVVRVEDKLTYDFAIDDDGYVLKRCFQHYKWKASSLIQSMSYILRVDCVYNDYIADQVK